MLYAAIDIHKHASVLIASWHVLTFNEPFKPSASSAAHHAPASSSIRLAA